MESSSGIVRQPFQNLRVLVDGVVIDYRVYDFSSRNGRLDGIEELPEFLVAVMRDTTPGDFPVQYVESSA